MSARHAAREGLLVLHLIRLWLRVELRARRARKTGTLVATMPALILTPGQPVRDGRVALAYRASDPYAVILWASAADETIITAAFARDLVAQAVTIGRSGYGHPEAQTVHIQRVNDQHTSVILDTSHPTPATILISNKAIRRATQTWYRRIPLGAEQVDLTGLEQHLTRAA